MKRRTVLAAAAGWAAAARVQAGAQRQAWPRERPTPALELPTLDGAAWRLAEQRGRVVALNFWASWCPPCRDEIPALELTAQRHEADGLLVMMVNFKEGAGTIRRFLEALPMDLPVLRDADGLAARAFGVRVFPTTVFVGRDGRAQFSVTGAADWTGEPARGWVRALF